mgnify:CR=1 FL=1
MIIILTATESMVIMAVRRGRTGAGIESGVGWSAVEPRPGYRGGGRIDWGVGLGKRAGAVAAVCDFNSNLAGSSQVLLHCSPPHLHPHYPPLALLTSTPSSQRFFISRFSFCTSFCGYNRLLINVFCRCNVEKTAFSVPLFLLRPMHM